MEGFDQGEGATRWAGSSAHQVPQSWWRRIRQRTEAWAADGMMERSGQGRRISKATVSGSCMGVLSDAAEAVDADGEGEPDGVGACSGGGGEFDRGGAVGALEAGAVALGHDVDVGAGLGEVVGGVGGAAGGRGGWWGVRAGRGRGCP